MMTNETSAIIAALAGVEAAVREQTALIASWRRETPGVLRPADRRALQSLLPAVAAMLADGNFACGELVADPSLPGDLTAALDEAVGPNDRGRARRLGKLLARSQGIAVDGFRVDRLGEFRRGVIWTVVRISSPR